MRSTFVLTLLSSTGCLASICIFCNKYCSKVKAKWENLENNAHNEAASLHEQ